MTLSVTKEIIWRGHAQAEVHLAYESLEKKKKKMKKTIHKLLKEFPPR